LANELAVIAGLKKTIEAYEILKAANDLLQKRCRFAELRALVFREWGEGLRQGFHAALTTFPHKADALGSCFEAHAAAVFRSVSTNQAGTLKTGNDAAHGGRTDLFGAGKFAERLWAAENEDRQRGKLGGAHATFAVADAKPAEQMDCSGVKLVGNVRRR
jgi:hypothetical protein